MNKNVIYGIEFDESIPFGGEKRILDSYEMENDYVIGAKFTGNGRNDFDQAYPFGAIRICNMKIIDGQKQIVYENDPAFSRTGESGNVMIEIPKFYSMREKKGTVERWMISGVCHPGFSIEPCFVRGGKELDAVYVGAYNSCNCRNGIYSATHTFPDVCKTITEFCREYKEDGYDSYDLAIHLCLQKLMVIEFNTRALKGKLGGIQFLHYFYKTDDKTRIRACGKNYVTVGSEDRMKLFYPGLDIQLGHKSHDPNVIHREIVKMEWNEKAPGLLDIYYAGDDLSEQLCPGMDGAGGIFQKNGWTDELPYHTGRCDNHPPCSPNDSREYLLNAFRYRGIENVWGNVWEFCSGLKIHQQQYYYTFDPEQYDQDFCNWKKLSYKAAVQPYLAEHNPAPAIWTDSMGYDSDEKLLPLPVSTTYGCPGNYYDAGFYCYHDIGYDDQPVNTDCVYCVGVGGGYDHYWYGSPFTYRCFLTEKTANWLYSNRVCLRK